MKNDLKLLLGISTIAPHLAIVYALLLSLDVQFISPFFGVSRNSTLGLLLMASVFVLWSISIVAYIFGYAACGRHIKAQNAGKLWKLKWDLILVLIPFGTFIYWYCFIWNQFQRTPQATIKS